MLIPMPLPPTSYMPPLDDGTVAHLNSHVHGYPSQDDSPHPEFSGH